MCNRQQASAQHDDAASSPGACCSKQAPSMALARTWGTSPSCTQAGAAGSCWTRRRVCRLCLVFGSESVSLGLLSSIARLVLGPGGKPGGLALCFVASLLGLVLGLVELVLTAAKASTACESACRCTAAAAEWVDLALELITVTPVLTAGKLCLRQQ